MKTGEKKDISRREFITLLWGFATVLPFIYGAFRFISPGNKKFHSYSERTLNQNKDKFEISLDRLSENSSKIVNIDDEPVIIIRSTGTDIRAYSAECTHLGCTVGYKKESNDFFCSCHGGRFDINGNAIEGPPKKPLTKYKVEMLGNILKVTKPV